MYNGEPSSEKAIGVAGLVVHREGEAEGGDPGVFVGDVGSQGEDSNARFTKGREASLDEVRTAIDAAEEGRDYVIVGMAGEEGVAGVRVDVAGVVGYKVARFTFEEKAEWHVIFIADGAVTTEF